MRGELRARLAELLEPLPTEEGGRAVIAAIDSSPPAMAMLSNGTVALHGGTLYLVIEAASSLATATPRTSATILVAGPLQVLRASLAPLSTRVYDELAVLSGPLTAIRPSVEMPWSLELGFVPTGLAAPEPFLEYWAAVRRWLADGRRSRPPAHPRAPG